LSHETLLNGIHILDLSQYIPGPFASLKMVEQGAEVIKVEPPGGDPMRVLGAEPGEISALYRHLNAGKKIVELDLKSVEGKRRLIELIRSADVPIEGFRPGTLAKLGFTYASLQALNSSLIVCSISGFGQLGDQSQRAGHDLGYAASTGLYSQRAGLVKPHVIFPPPADHAAALKALAMVCAALVKQARSGQGSVLDISIAGALADWQYTFTSDSLCRQLGGEMACYNIYQAADGKFVTLAAVEHKFWANFCLAVNRPDWVDRQQEILPQEALIAEVAELFMQASAAEWVRRLATVDCCFEVVVSQQALREQHSFADLDFVDINELNWSNT